MRPRRGGSSISRRYCSSAMPRSRSASTCSVNALADGDEQLTTPQMAIGPRHRVMALFASVRGARRGRGTGWLTAGASSHDVLGRPGGPIPSFSRAAPHAVGS
jgi:hypothetical protein